MKKITSLLFLLFSVQFAVKVFAGDKMYVWCPPEQIIIPKTGTLKGCAINLVVSDKRNLSSKTRDKCSSEELVADVTNLIKGTYPSAKINVVKSADGNVEKNKVTIEIDIVAYFATFSTAMWHASTGYSVTISDYRKDKLSEQNKNILEERSFFNAIGFTTAKSNLNKTYTEANDDLLNFISNNAN